MHTAGQHKVRVRPATPGGMLHKGNRYTVNTARTTPLASSMAPAWHGTTNTVPSQATLNAIANRAITGGYKQGKRNPLCPGCGMLRSTSNKCWCNS